MDYSHFDIVTDIVGASQARQPRIIAGTSTIGENAILQL